MASNSNWKDILKAQYADLQQLEAMDAELNVNQQTITANIDKILKKKGPSAISSTAATRKSFSRESKTLSNEPLKVSEAPIRSRPSSAAPRPKSGNNTDRFNKDKSITVVDQDLDESIPEESNFRPIPLPQSPHLGGGPPSPLDADLPKAPETQIRYHKAKSKMLEQQVAEFGEIRRQLNEQVNDLQKLLKVEKEENKQLKKR